MARVLGIDLGTTNSCVAIVEGNSPVVLPVDGAAFTLPSIVGFPKKGGHHLIGATAKRQSVVNPEGTVFAAKRLIGRKFADPQSQKAMAAFPYRCVEGPQGDIRINAGGRLWAIQEISALVLAAVKMAAEARLGEAITKAIITVPAYFNDHQRQATRDAGTIAGFDVLRVINEPTAAALAHGYLDGTERLVAVYDLGGGTFDISVLRVGGGFVEVLATAGDPFLGGTDFDERVIAWLNARIAQEHGASLQDDLNAQQRLREAAEAARIDLSDNNQSHIALPFLGTAPDGRPIHFETDLDRPRFESLVEDLVERSVDLLRQTLAAPQLKEARVDQVLLVGGMTRTPLIRRRVFETTGQQPAAGVHPDVVVAVGAAIQGSLLAGGDASVILVDVTPYDLGIMTVAGIAETIIPKDTSVPTEVRRLFCTAKDDQDAVDVVVYQGQSRRIDDNEILGKFTLEGLRRGPRGSVRIEVTFSITADGMVNVKARDVDTQQEQRIRVKGRGGLDERQIQGMQEKNRAVTQNANAPARL